LLRSLGYQVVSVRDGKEALYALDDADDFDLLFTDVVMPGGMNGLELADTARRTRPNLPVLFTSGYTEDAIVRGDRLGRDAQILFKPYHRQALAEKLRGVLDRPAGPSRLDKAAD
jgi:CheY-like chemotaxis protein